MLENVSIFVPNEVEEGARGQKRETGNRELLALFPNQHLIELCLERMEVKNIGGGVTLLLLGERWRAPIRGLLLLRELDPQQLAAEIFQPVLIGEGARELRCDLGTVYRRRHSAEIMCQHGDVEAAEMEDFEDFRIG